MLVHLNTVWVEVIGQSSRLQEVLTTEDNLAKLVRATSDN